MFSHWKALFYFTKKEQQGILVMGLILTLSVGLHFILSDNKTGANGKRIDKHKQTPVPQTFFIFDPNTVNETAALRLGFSSKQYRVLENYRNKGGVFRKPEDILHLYGLQKKFANDLIPYIKLEPTVHQSTLYKKEGSYTFINKHSLSWVIDINDTNQNNWLQLTNLPPTTIQSILRYQKSNNGFDKVTDVEKVFGLSQKVYDTLKPHLVMLAKHHFKMNANKMKFEQWASLQMFTTQEIWNILKLKKAGGGQLGWRKLAISLDLTEGQVAQLRRQIDITD